MATGLRIAGTAILTLIILVYVFSTVSASGISQSGSGRAEIQAYRRERQPHPISVAGYSVASPASTPTPAARAAAILRNPKFQTFLIAWLAYVGFYLCRKNFSVIIPLLIHDEGIPKDVVAQSVFAFSCGYVFGQFVMGLLADRFGARPIAFTGMAISTCATAAMGFSGGRWLLARALDVGHKYFVRLLARLR